MTESTATLHQHQRSFTAYLRHPTAAPPEALDAERMGVYRRLIRGNLTGLLESAFPVCAAMLGQDALEALVMRFLQTHRSATPLFTELAAEFVEWLQGETALPHPALPELAHYEWVETALYQLDARPLRPLPTGNLLDHPLQCSPLARALVYRWPVHQLGPHHAPTHPPPLPTALLVRRDQAGDVRFSVLGLLAAQLLHAIDASPGRTGAVYLRDLAQQHGLDALAWEPPFNALLHQLHGQGVIGQPTDPEADSDCRGV